MWECPLPQLVRIRRPLDKTVLLRMPRGFFGPAPPVGAPNRDDVIVCDDADWSRATGPHEPLEGEDLAQAVKLARLRAKQPGMECVVTRVHGRHLVNWLTGRGAPTCESGHFTPLHLLTPNLAGMYAGSAGPAPTQTQGVA